MKGLIWFIAIIFALALTAKAIHHYNGECYQEICPADSIAIESADTTKVKNQQTL